MRTFRLFLPFLLLALLLSACNSEFFQRWRGTPTPGFPRQPTWTRIPSRTPSITPTRKPRPTHTITPIPSLTPTRKPTRTPFDSPAEAGGEDTGAVDNGIAIPGTLGISYLQVKNNFEPLGFVFPESISPFSGQAYTATLPAIPLDLELWGAPEALSEASLSFTLILDDPQRTSQATVIMVRLLNLVQPAWDEAASWVYEGIQEGLASSDNSYDRFTQRDGLVVILAMDHLEGSVILTVRGIAP